MSHRKRRKVPRNEEKESELPPHKKRKRQNNIDNSDNCFAVSDNFTDVKNGNDIFRIDVINDTQTKFSERGRKQYNVTGRYTMEEDIQITHNADLNVYNISVVMDCWTLSKTNPLYVEILLKSDEDIFSQSESFTIPSSEKLDYIDNGVFCCCSATHVQQNDYDDQMGDESDESDDTSTTNNSNSKSKSNHNSKIAIKIIENSVRIKNGKIGVKFSVDGMDDMEQFIVNENANETKEDETKWIMCDGCYTWQHKNCMGWTIAQYNAKILTHYHLCPLLCSNTIYGNNITSLPSKYTAVIAMIAKISQKCKKNKCKRYKDIFMKHRSNKEKTVELRSYTKKQLIKLSYCIGIAVNGNVNFASKNNLARKILNADIFEQTPPKLANEIASTDIDGIDKKSKLRIADLCCGNGAITVWISQQYPNSQIYAFDINGARIAAAKQLYGKKYKNITWITKDVIGLRFIDKYIVNGNGFDLVIGNHPFEQGFAMIYVSLELIKKSKNVNGALICLLPECYFGTTDSSKRLTRMLKFNIVNSKPCGRHNYHQTYDKFGNINTKSGSKLGSDAIWTIKPCINGTHCNYNQKTNKIEMEKRLKYESMSSFILNV